MDLIPRYHMVMSKENFLEKRKSGLLNGFYGSLSYYETEKSSEKFLNLLTKVGKPWFWDNIKKYKNKRYVQNKIIRDDAKLYYIFDDLKVIGYLFTARPDKSELELVNLNSSGLNHRVIEIENIGLFPNQAGKGRGLKLFDMVLENSFKENDYVYLSMSSTNHPNLYDFYTKKLGMTHVATSHAPDPRPVDIKVDPKKIAA